MTAINLSSNALPKQWIITKLPDFTRVVMGQSPSSDTYNFDGTGLPFFQGKAEFGVTYPTINKYCSIPNKIAEQGATLLSVRAPVGPTNLASTRCCIGRGLAAIHPLSGVDPKFILLLFRSIELNLSGEGTGSTFSAITKAYVDDLRFAIPPLNEQKRIVAKIEELFSELDKGIESLQTAREQLKVYRQAVLKHAFEGKLTEQWRKDNADKLESPEQLLARIQQERDARYQQQLEDWKTAVKEWETNGKEGKKPGKPKKSKSSVECFVESITVPNAWAFTSVGELNADIFDGPFGSNLKSNDYVDEGVRVIRLENIGMMQFIHDKYSFVTEEKYQQIKKHTVSAGDIIFSSFITESIRVTQLPASIDRAINKADCFCIRLFGHSYRARFLTLYLSSRSAYHQVESAIHGIGRPRINTTQLKSFVVPLCSEAEQSQILAEIDRQMSEIDASDKSITEQLTKAETLRQSILKKAFSGQLVPQDPNDEPASELLVRIQAEKAALSTAIKKTRKSK